MRFNPLAIKAARRTRAYTQDMLAEKVGVCRNSIVRAENGECSDKLARKIADACGVLVENLMYDEKAHAMPPDGMAITGAERQVLVAMRELDLLGKKLILRLAMELASGESPVAALAACLQMTQPARVEPEPPKVPRF